MKPPMKNPSVSAVLDLYDYNPETGIFLRKRTVAYNAKAGDVAGTPDGKGYLKISISGRQYFAHRMAWLVVHGDMPPVMIDHRNGNRSDNRIANLRLADSSENAQNQRNAQKGSKTGLLGVRLDARWGRYTSQIMVRGKLHWLGSFGSAEEASTAYLSAKKKLHAYAPGSTVG